MTNPANAELTSTRRALAGRPLQDTLRLAEGTPVLTVLIPVYNEAETVDELLRRVVAAPYGKQVIVVDDGSTDETAKALDNWKRSPEITLLRHPTNRGKGAAIRTGLEHAHGRFTVIQDGDLEYDPQDYRKLIEPLISGDAQVVFGSRRLNRVRRWRDWLNPFYHGVSLLNAWVRLLYGSSLTDEGTCYKAFPTQMLRAMNLQCERFEFCPEVTAKACRLGVHILEVPIHYQARTRRAGSLTWAVPWGTCSLLPSGEGGRSGEWRETDSRWTIPQSWCPRRTSSSARWKSTTAACVPRWVGRVGETQNPFGGTKGWAIGRQHVPDVSEVYVGRPARGCCGPGGKHVPGNTLRRGQIPTNHLGKLLWIGRPCVRSLG